MKEPRQCLTCHYHGPPISNFDILHEVCPCIECIKSFGRIKWISAKEKKELNKKV